jgi:hypothetical protein
MRHRPRRSPRGSSSLPSRCGHTSRQSCASSTCRPAKRRSSCSSVEEAQRQTGRAAHAGTAGAESLEVAVLSPTAAVVPLSLASGRRPRPRSEGTQSEVRVPLVRGSSAPISVQRYERKDRSAGPCPRRATRQHWVSGHCGCPVCGHEGERQPTFRRASTRQASSHWTHLPEHDVNAVLGQGFCGDFRRARGHDTGVQRGCLYAGLVPYDRWIRRL